MAKESIKPGRSDAKVFQVNDVLYLVKDAVIAYDVMIVHENSDGSFQYQCRNPDTEYIGLFNDDMDNIFRTYDEAETYIQRLKIIRDMSLTRTERIMFHHRPKYVKGERVYDVDAGYVRGGKVLDVVPWPQNDGCMYLCEEDDGTQDRYVIHNTVGIFRFSDSASIALQDLVDTHKYFNVDEVLFYVLGDCRVVPYRVIRVYAEGGSLMRYNVRELDNHIYSSFYSDNRFIFHSLDDAEKFSSIKKFEREYLDTAVLRCTESMPLAIANDGAAGGSVAPADQYPLWPEDDAPQTPESYVFAGPTDGAAPLADDSDSSSDVPAVRRNLFTDPRRTRKRRELRSLLEYRPKRNRSEPSRFGY